MPGRCATGGTDDRCSFFYCSFLNPFEFIRFTPGTNCGECGHPTCLAFAVAVTKGGMDPSRCPYVDTDALPAGSSSTAGGDSALAATGQLQQDVALAVHLKSRLRGIDLASLAPRLGGTVSGMEADRLLLSFLGRQIEISREEILMNGRQPVDPRDQILLYNYVASGGGAAPRGEWVGMESLPNSISKVRTLAAYCEHPLAVRFSRRSRELSGVCSKIGAVADPEAQSGDLAFIIPVLPHVPHYLLFWDEDREEDFECRVKVLFDRHVLDFLDIESLVFSAERMAERLMELDS